MQGQYHGRRTRTAASKDIWFIKDGKRAYYCQDHRDKEHLFYLRNGNVKELFDLSRTVYFRSFISIFRNILDRHDKQHGNLSGTLPLGYSDHCIHGSFLASQPDLCQVV